MLKEARCLPILPHRILLGCGWVTPTGPRSTLIKQMYATITTQKQKKQPGVSHQVCALYLLKMSLQHNTNNAAPHSTCMQVHKATLIFLCLLFEQNRATAIINAAQYIKVILYSLALQLHPHLHGHTQTRTIHLRTIRFHKCPSTHVHAHSVPFSFANSSLLDIWQHKH